METETMSSVLASVSTRKEKAAKAMASLHSHRNLITSCIADWENLERSFGVTERALQQKFKELSERESAFDAKMQEARVVLEKREESIAGREDASLSRVEEQKVTAIAVIAQERCKFEEERMKWRAEKGVSGQETEPDAPNKDARQGKVHTETPPKVRDNTAVKDNKEKGAQRQHVSKATPSKENKEVHLKKGSSVDLASKSAGDKAVRKETPSVGHSEEKREKEAGVAARGQRKEEEIKEGKNKGDGQDQTSKNKRKDATVAADEAAAKRRKEASEPGAQAAAGSGTGMTVKHAPSLEEAAHLVKVAAEAPAPMQIKYLVEKLDYQGLKEFFIINKKELQKLRPDLQAALQASSDPCRLSLKILEVSEGAERVSENSKIAYSSIILLECLSEVVADPVLGVDFPVVPSDVKEIAKNLARRWKSLLERHPQDGYTLASHLFLQLLATFGIGTDYGVEDLLKYVVSMSRRGIGPALCRTLGLTEKIPVVVDGLIREGKQIDAIAYVSKFGLFNKYSPGTLLKTYLEDLQKAFDTEKATSMGDTATELYTKQISALKNVVKVIEEHKLESQFSLDDIHNRISALKQERAEVKKTSSNVKQETQHGKDPHDFDSRRPNGASSRGDDAGTRGFDSAHAAHGGHISSLDRGQYIPTDLGRVSRVDYTPTDVGRPLLLPYNLDRLNRRSESVYDSYGLGGRSPVSLSNSHMYATRDGYSSSFASSRSGTGINSYGGLPRDDPEMLSNYPASRSRPPYPEETHGASRNYHLGSDLPPSSRSRPPYPEETHGPSRNYHLGSELPPSSNYLPYYMR